MPDEVGGNVHVTPARSDEDKVTVISDEFDNTKGSGKRDNVTYGNSKDPDWELDPELLSKLADVLSYTLDWNTRIMNQGLHNHALDIICLSIAALGEFICAFIRGLDEDKWLRYSNSNYLFNRMLDDGWCPIEIIRLRNMADLDQIYFISNLDRSTIRSRANGHGCR